MTTTITFHAMVVTCAGEHACDTCGRPAEFWVGCADDRGGLVAEIVEHVCVEHLAAAVRWACAVD